MEKRDYGFDMEGLHKVQYQILKKLDRVCKKYHIRYFLAYGTLLGAVRQNGFIPWDDDVDTVMPYRDFLKLQRVPAEEWTKEGFFLQSSVTDPEYCKCYLKLRKDGTTLIVDDVMERDIHHGVAIDIYPIFRLADDRRKRFFQYAQAAAYSLLQENHIPKNHGKLLAVTAGCILAVIPERFKHRLKKRLITGVAKYDFCDTRECFIMAGNPSCLRELVLCEDFKKAKKWWFENSWFPVPVGYDDYLTRRYGDYMKLPPEEEQGVKLEHFVKIDLERSYLEYKGVCYCVKLI